MECDKHTITFEDLACDFYESEPIFVDIWHYTSANGMNGIIQKNGILHFWFSRSDCLNDTSEGKEINDYYQMACLLLLQKGEISEEFFDCIKDLNASVTRTFEFPLASTTEAHTYAKVCRAECEAYICCFSLQADSLDMWRYYSKSDGGYSLQFDATLFDYWGKTLYSNPLQYPKYAFIESMKVVYNPAEKRELILNIIKKVYSAFSIDKTETGRHAASRYIIESELQRLQFKFKHECFASEKEYRFVLYLPKKKPTDMCQDLPSIQFRTMNGVIVPYIDLEIPNGNELLQNLLVSPFIIETAKENALRSFLDSRGFHNCNIAFSSLPVRLC